MDNKDLRVARASLGLSVADMARMLETDALSVRRMELSPDKSTHRKPAPRMVRLIRAYLDGYRPSDWPAEENPDHKQ